MGPDPVHGRARRQAFRRRGPDGHRGRRDRRGQEPPAMTKVDPEVRIPDPIELDRAEEDRLRAAAGLRPIHREPPEYAGFEQVGIPDRPPQTDREREVYTLDEGEMLLNLGPQHPSTHGVMRLVVKVRGEVILEVDPVLGYLHRGIEKLCENATYTTVLTYVDPMDYLATMHNEHAPAIAFEKLYGVKAPKRAEYIRALVVELNRIFSHGLMMGFLALDMGGLTPILYSFINRDEIVDMLSAISGQRMLFNFFRVGGVNWDVNDEFLSRLGDWRSRALRTVEDNERVLTENEIFTARTKKMGVISHQAGDSYSRYMQRIAEIKQSIRLIDQIMEKMPHGPVSAQVPGIIRPRPGRALAA